MTITDADLERLLTLAAAEYPIPADGIEAVLAAERAPAPPTAHRLRTLGRTGPGRGSSGRPAWLRPRRLAISVAALAVLGVFIGGVVTAGPAKHASSTSTATGAAAGALSAPSGNRTAPDRVTGAGAAVVPSDAFGKYAPGAPASEAVPAALAPGSVTSGPAAGVPPAGPAPAVAAPQKAVVGAASALGSSGSSATTSGSVAAAADAGATDSAKIVRTGQADLTVAKGSVPVAQGRLEGLATAFGGYVSSESTTGGDDPSASVTLRVPGDRFANLVTEVQKIGKVADLSTQAADVTSQYTDLTARIHALQVQRDTYLTLLAKATSIQETLAVQQRVDGVQTQLEQLQGQQKVLDDQTAFGSLSVTVSQEGKAVVSTLPKARTGFAKAWYDAKHRFNGGLQGLVAASGPAAFVVLLGLAAWGLWLIVRRRWQRARV